MSLIAGALVEVEDLSSTLHAMALYIATVISGLLLHQLIILPLIYVAVIRKNPARFFLTTLEAMLAGGAASSRYCTDTIFVLKISPLSFTVQWDSRF